VTSADCRVAVVIPTYNSERWIDDCLASVLSQAGVYTEVVVVDNDSTDGTVELVRARWPSVRVLALDRNIGYGASVNSGAQALESGPILALNPDAALEPGCLVQLARALDRDPRVGVAAPRLIASDGTTQPSAHRFPTIPRLFAESLGLDRLPVIGHSLDYHCRDYKYDRSRAVDWATGVALLIHREAWRRCDGFDARYFLYAEEIDLQYRMRQAGFAVVLDPEAIAVHHGGNQPLDARRFLLAHDGLVRFLGAERRSRAVAVRMALTVTALTRALAWAATGVLVSHRRVEAQRWSRMFLRVFLGSAGATGRLIAPRCRHSRRPGDRTQRPCYICGVIDNPVIAHEEPVEERQGRPLLPEGVYRFARCRSCGTLYVDSAVTDDFLAQVYAGETPETSGEASGKEHAELVAGREPEFEHHWRRLSSLRPPEEGDALIDVGCQTGDFGDLAKRSGVAPHGIELSTAYAAISRARWGDSAPVHCGPLDSAPFPPGEFAYVTAFETLEHVCDPTPMLRTMRSWLAPGGLVAVSVPASDYFHLKYWVLARSPLSRLLRPWLLRRSPFYVTQILPHTHIYNFSDRSLRAMLERAGLQVSSTEPVGWHGRLARPLDRLGRLLYRVSRRRVVLAPSLFAVAEPAPRSTRRSSVSP